MHDAYSSQAAEQLVEIGLGYLLTGGDFGALHRALAERAGKLDHGVGARFAAHGQSHGKLSNPINIIKNSFVDYEYGLWGPAAPLGPVAAPLVPRYALLPAPTPRVRAHRARE